MAAWRNLRGPDMVLIQPLAYYEQSDEGLSGTERTT